MFTRNDQSRRRYGTWNRLHLALRTIQELFGPTHNPTQILLLPYLSSIFFHREKRRRHEVDTTEHLVRDITQYFITTRVFRAPPRGGAGTTTITLLCIITYFVIMQSRVIFISLCVKSNIAVDCHLH